MHRKEGMLKWPIVYLRHIKIMSCHMESIHFRHHLTWKWQQCVHIYHQNMHYHIWKCVLRCCEECPRIDIPITEPDQQNSNFSPIIRFNVYQHIAHCTVHIISTFNKKKKCQLCEASTYAILTGKPCTRKEIFMME